MNFTIPFFIAVMATVMINLSYLLGMSWVWIPLLVGVALLAWLMLRTRPQLLRGVVARANVVVLLLVSSFLSVQIWLLLTSGSARISTGHLLPLFIGVLILYLYNVYIYQEINSRAEQAHPVDALVRWLMGPPLVSTFCIALVVAAYTLVILHGLYTDAGIAEGVSKRFLQRGIIPPITLCLFFWALLLLCGKWIGIWYVRQASQGSLSDWTSAHVISDAMANLRKKPKVLDQQLRLLWQRSTESYLLPRYINWAVPILGFIGTVLGISLASDGIRRIISSADGLSQLSGDLGEAIAPLGIAFDTTLIALSLSVVLTLVQTLVQRQEERLLANIEVDLRATGSA